MGTCFESRTQESLLAFACHFRKSSATLEDALAFPEIQCFEGFEPRTLRLLLFLRNSSDLELLVPVADLAACLYLEEGGAPPGVGSGIRSQIANAKAAFKIWENCPDLRKLRFQKCKSDLGFGLSGFKSPFHPNSFSGTLEDPAILHLPEKALIQIPYNHF